jgi:hypothetical protein
MQKNKHQQTIGSVPPHRCHRLHYQIMVMHEPHLSRHSRRSAAGIPLTTLTANCCHRQPAGGGGLDGAGCRLWAVARHGRPAHHGEWRRACTPACSSHQLASVRYCCIAVCLSSMCAAQTGGLGTYEYMAPEVLAHQRYSEKVRLRLVRKSKRCMYLPPSCALCCSKTLLSRLDRQMCTRLGSCFGRCAPEQCHILA